MDKDHEKYSEKGEKEEKEDGKDAQNKLTDKDKLVEPRGNIVFRQELISLTPECGVQCALVCNIIMVLVFIGLGVPVIMFTQAMTEYIIDYNDCLPNQYCDKTLQIKQDLQPPIYIYYELHNFYANHRDYVRSREFAQLRGEIFVSDLNNSLCEGARYVWEMFNNDTSKYYSRAGVRLNHYDFVNPCGFIAKSLFSDTYGIYRKDNFQNVFVNETNIANDYDKSFVFIKPTPDKKYYNNRTYLDLQWLDVTNDYNVKAFSGKKFFVLTSSNFFGTSAFFGYTLVIGGCYCIIVLILILGMYFKNKEKKYDYISLKWN